jgi:major membrane immunogen (membrane-anchored lipoprotein)
MLNGYYRDSVVYLNADLAPAGTGDAGVLSNRLVKVALEEVAHYVTGATDNSRDFQDYLLELAVKLARSESEVGA